MPSLRPLSAALVLIGLLPSLSCGYVAPKVPVSGTPADLERFAGEWFGEYVGDRDHNRQGSITFKLVAGRDEANGDILMIPAGFDQPYQRLPNDPRPAPPPGAANRVLTIRFVKTDRDRVSGTTDPYWDPDRRTEALSTFSGTLDRNTITGEFRTTYANGAAGTAGTWKVTRR